MMDRRRVRGLGISATLVVFGSLTGCGAFNSPSSGSLAVLFTAAVTVTASSSTYSIGPSQAAENPIVLPRAGTLKSLYVSPSAAPASGTVVAVTARLNRADTPLAVTHAASSSGSSTVTNTSDTVSAAAGDLLSLRFQETGGVSPGGSVRYRASLTFEGGAELILVSGVSLTASSTYWGPGSSFATELPVPLARAGSLKALYLVPSEAPASGAVVRTTIRINGADTALVATHTAGSDGSGAVKNTSDAVSVSAGDRLSIQIQETGGVNPGGAVLYGVSLLFQ